MNFSRNYDDSQWIEESDGHYVFGRIRQKTVGLQTRVNYTVTPTLSIQIYAEPFVSAGDYSDFKALVNGRAPVYEDRYAPYAYTGNPDFNYRSFRTTNVLRWEYKPGSTLFVVWQQGREGNLDHGDVRLLARLRRRVLVAGEERLPHQVGILAELLTGAFAVGV